MTTKEITYFRTFNSRTNKMDISHHGSPEWEDFQDNSLEDIRIRREIEEKFALFNLGDSKYPKYNGFDGRHQYVFMINKGTSRKSSSENQKYTTEIKIQKAGAEKDLIKICDLERFLLREKFKPQK